MIKSLRLVLLLAVIALSCQREERLRMDNTHVLISELLTKLDSADVYAARTETEIVANKLQLSEDGTYRQKCALLYEIANLYAHYALDSSLVYIEKSAALAKEFEDEDLVISAEIRRSTLLTIGGFYKEASDVLASVPRDKLQDSQLSSYYKAYTSLYHELYSSSYEPATFREEYADKYNAYRDSLLNVVDTMSLHYLRNMEKKEARAGNLKEARRYNSLREENITDHKSLAYATCLYDRFMLAYQYEESVTSEDIDNLLEAAIIELECCNRDVNSMLRVVSILNDMGEVENAKKVSDYYYASLLKFGSKKRILECGLEAMTVNEQNLAQINKGYQLISRKNRQFIIAIVFLSLMAIALMVAMLKIIRSHRKITVLKDNLQQSGKISKGYLGVVFKLYSSYIKRLELFRAKIYSTLKKGNVEQTLELASPSKDLISEERKNLFHHFDTAFVDIFPDFIEVVNSCLKPEMIITPKRTEVLNNELRIIALIKLGIEDNDAIAEMLHCSVKTVMNLKAIFRSRLAVPKERFNKVIMDL